MIFILLKFLLLVGVYRIYPFTFLIEPDQLNNLSSSSIALVFQLRAIDKRRLKHKIGKLEKRMILHIKQILKEIMELNTK